jgi:hypothetical protein
MNSYFLCKYLAAVTCIADFFVVSVTGPVSLVEGEDNQCGDYERESDWDYGHYLATKDAAKGTESAPSFLSSDCNHRRKGLASL